MPVSYAPMFEKHAQCRIAVGLALGLFVVLLGACQTGPGAGQPGAITTPTVPPPRWRAGGERLPAFSGAAPRARGWEKVDDLLWIEGRDLAAYEAGRVSNGSVYVPVNQAAAPGVGAQESLRLRTDHIALRTNIAWARALIVAREAEAHVQRLVGPYGETLGLRLPDGPLGIVVTATRAEFEQLLRGRVQDPVGWGAFYDARDGRVYISVEAARSGALPWRADLRHEMTHQILDLSRRESRRARPFALPWFWLWEGIAVWSETLGDPPGVDTGRDRIVRFQKRYAGNEWTPLATLFQLAPTHFEGRHYDQAASLMRYLLDPAAPGRRAAVFDLVRRLLLGPIPAEAFTQAVSTGLPQLEAGWRETVGR